MCDCCGRYSTACGRGSIRYHRDVNSNVSDTRVSLANNKQVKFCGKAYVAEFVQDALDSLEVSVTIPEVVSIVLEADVAEDSGNSGVPSRSWKLLANFARATFMSKETMDDVPSVTFSFHKDTVL